MVTGTSVAASPLSCRNRVSRISIRLTASIKLESDGTFIVHSGGADIGTGLDTVVTKLAAEVLHCPPQDVHVISGDTDHALFDKGAYASSGTCFSGNAARLAAENLREKILFHGAQMLGEAVADVPNWQRRASCAARKEKSASGILLIKAKPAPALVHWWNWQLYHA